MRKHPRDFWRTFSVNQVERSGKAMIKTQGRASRLAPQGGTVAGLQPFTGAANGMPIQPTAQNGMTRHLRLAVLASRDVPWGQCRAHRCGEPCDADDRRGPAQAFVDSSYVPCEAKAIGRP